MMEGCDCPHCRKCGGHYEPGPDTPNGVCDACILGQVQAETEAQVRDFDGNSEAAAAYWGW